MSNSHNAKYNLLPEEEVKSPQSEENDDLEMYKRPKLKFT